MDSQKAKAQDSKTMSVTIIDNGLEIEIETTKKKVEDLLTEVNITFNSEDLIFPDLLSEVDQNYKIFIYRKAAENAITTYIVQPGDTISSLAKKFGITWNTIKWANNLENYDEISPGQILIILPVTGILHTVSEGETINGIALNYKGDAKEIIEYNRIKDPENLTPGEKIIIPNGRIFEPPKPKVVSKESETKTEPKPNPPSQPETKEPQSDKSLVGMASWYDWKSGLGCASLKFPLGTRLKVTNLTNGASCEVVVFDRGPYNSRIIDLTKEAFSKIAHLGSGVIKVKVEEIK